MSSLRFARVTPIRRAEKLSRDEFESTYFLPDRPVIVETGTDGLSIARLGELYGKEQISLGPVRSPLDSVPLSEVVDTIVGARPHRRIYFQHPLEEAWRNDLQSKLSCTSWVPDSESAFLWIGTHDAGGIGLHQDDGYRNLLIQMSGRKHCILIPPSDADRLAPVSLYHSGSPHFPYEFDSFRSEITSSPDQGTAFSIDWEAFPELRHADAHIGTLNPGECLYIPTSWFHLMTVLEANGTLSLRWHNREWLDNRRTFHLVMDLALSFLRQLPPAQRGAFASRLAYEAKKGSFVERSILGGVMPPSHLFGWAGISTEILVSLTEIAMVLHEEALKGVFPRAVLESLRARRGAGAAAEGFSQSQSRPSTDDPVPTKVKAILQQLADRTEKSARVYREGACIPIDKIDKSVVTMIPEVSSLEMLHELLTHTAEFH